MLDDLNGGLMADGNRKARSHKGEYDGKDEWLGQPTLH